MTARTREHRWKLQRSHRCGKCTETTAKYQRKFHMRIARRTAIMQSFFGCAITSLTYSGQSLDTQKCSSLQALFCTLFLQRGVIVFTSYLAIICITYSRSGSATPTEVHVQFDVSRGPSWHASRVLPGTIISRQKRWHRRAGQALPLVEKPVIHCHNI